MPRLLLLQHTTSPADSYEADDDTEPGTPKGKPPSQSGSSPAWKLPLGALH